MYLFKNAYDDSILNKNYCLLVIHEIESIFQINNKYSPELIESLKKWFGTEITKYTIKTSDRMNGNLIVIMTSQ